MLVGKRWSEFPVWFRNILMSSSTAEYELGIGFGSGEQSVIDFSITFYIFNSNLGCISARFLEKLWLIILTNTRQIVATHISPSYTMFFCAI